MYLQLEFVALLFNAAHLSDAALLISDNVEYDINNLKIDIKKKVLNHQIQLWSCLCCCYIRLSPFQCWFWQQAIWASFLNYSIHILVYSSISCKRWYILATRNWLHKANQNQPRGEIACCIEVISYGVSFGANSDYFQMGESSAWQAVSKLARGVFNNNDIMEKFMRSMTQTDAAMLLELHKNKHGVPGMIGCLDCMHVTWENFPNSLCSQHVEKEVFQL